MGGHILRGTTNRPREWAVHKLYTAMQFPAHKVWISEPDSYVDLYEPAPHDQFEPRPVVGDVVVIGAAPTSDQWLAVVVEVYGKGSRYDDVYALRGCGYTTIVNWSNCGLRVLNRQWVKDNSRFFWTDAEWQFEDKIERAHKLVGHDTNEFRKIEPVFNGEDATLSYRRKWNTFDEDGYHDRAAGLAKDDAQGSQSGRHWRRRSIRTEPPFESATGDSADESEAIDGITRMINEGKI